MNTPSIPEVTTTNPDSNLTPTYAPRVPRQTMREAVASLGERVKSQRLAQAAATVEPQPVNTKSTAFQFGVRDAQAGTPRKPEEVFRGEQEQREYQAGIDSATKPAAAPVAKPIITPNYKSNGNDYRRRTDSDADRVFRADEARDRTDDTPEYQEWYATYQALEAKLQAQLSPKLFSEIYDVIWQGSNVRGELMFLEGWRMRGNPDSIFELD